MTDSAQSAGKQQADSLPWYKNAATLIALVAMLVSVVSAVASTLQANTASRQNTEAQQQQVLTLVADIAQEPGQVAQESVTFKNSQSAFVSANAGTLDAEIADGEEAASIINSLHGQGITAIEYYETANALADGSNNAGALSFYQKAEQQGSDPRTRASAFRGAASIYYSLDRIATARHDITLAERAFIGIHNMPFATIQENTALTELFDAYYEASISCVTARAELSAAQKILSEDPSALTSIVANQERQDEKDLPYYKC